MTPSRTRSYCGVEPAAIFISRDAGETWTLNDGLWNHPHRQRWEPGGGGLCLHTILLDPEDLQRVRVAISTGGMYVSEDGGSELAAVEPWRPRRFPPRQEPRVRPVRPQGRAVEDPAGAHVPAEPLGPVSQRRSRRELDRHRQRRSVRLRLRPWRSIRATRRAPGSCRSNRTSSAARPEGKLRVYRTRDAGASLGAARRTGCRRTAPTRRCFATRSPSTRSIGRRLLRHAQRQDLRLRGRGRAAGPSCSTACRRSSPSRPRRSDAVRVRGPGPAA